LKKKDIEAFFLLLFLLFSACRQDMLEPKVLGICADDVGGVQRRGLALLNVQGTEQRGFS